MATAKHRLTTQMNKTFVFFLSTFLAGALFGGNGKLAKELESLDPASNVDVIVQFKQAPTEAHHQKIKQRGGVHKKSLDVVNGSLYSVPAGRLKELADDPDVASISPDRAVTAASDQSMVTIGAEIARTYGYDGTGIGIAVIDSGVYAIELDYTAKTVGYRVVYSESFVPNQAGTNDVYGHGTHVTGIVAGNGKLSSCSGCTQTFRGVATNANIINLRALDNLGAGTDSAVIAAIQRAIALKSTYNIRVMNLSLGRPVASSYLNDPLCQAVEAAWKAGIVVVVAAGNEGRNNSAGTSG